jgi:nitrite reductase/ring-hydroxylating ferredoxin subunit
MSAGAQSRPERDMADRRAERNRLLTETGPGTLMGDLVRRYWMPALLACELEEPDGPPVRVRLLGEQLVAFRDTQGRIGLIEEFCAHRRVSLWFGKNEECGLRCPYHGWKYDVTGQCVDLPSEPDSSGVRARMKLAAYPCIERGGVIWAYMGPPELQPEPPGLEWVLVPAERRYITKRIQECNYLQALEGGIDSSHVGFLHEGSLKTDPLFMGPSKGNIYTAHDRAPYFEVEEYDGGLLIAVRRNAEEGRYYWRITPFMLPFYTLVPPRGTHPISGHAWVPIDDESCWAWSISYHPSRALTKKELGAMKAPSGIHVRYEPGSFMPLANKRNDYLVNRAAQAAGLTVSGIEGVGMQDAAVQESMGPIVDRAKEHLVGTDKGIIITRNLLLRLAEDNRKGSAPPGLSSQSQLVRSCAIELAPETPFRQGAEHGLFPELNTPPVTV